MENPERHLLDLLSELGETAVELYDRIDLRREMEEHPYRTLGVAAAVGYVLGGGLFTSFTRRLVGVGARLLLLPLAQATLGQIISELEAEIEEPRDA
ncbi:MAG TPA: hypothetical protein VKY51_07330 [Fredinandcohnia sp.]|nr:hypothetical protein [Fredinandcohnia sp.]